MELPISSAVHRSSTCAGLNGTELRAGRTACSCDGVRPCRKGTPSEGRRWAYASSRSGLSEEGAFNSVSLSNKVEIWHRDIIYVINTPSMQLLTVKKPHISFSVPTRWLGRLSPSRVQFMTLSRITLRTSGSLYARRSSEFARHERLPSLKLQIQF